MCDEPPIYKEECRACGGEGGYYERRPFWDDPDFCVFIGCDECGGFGWYISDDPAKLPEPDDDWFENDWFKQVA